MANPASLPTVTVVIPAHNEVGTIGSLLQQVISQTENGFRLEKIIVFSDGSTDGTEEEARSIQDSRIVVHTEHERQGLAKALNTLFGKTTSDVAVLLNADIALSNSLVITRLVEPILTSQADLTAGLITEMPSRSWIASALTMGMQWKRSVFMAWREGQNLFTCFGPARAFSRRFYSVLRFPFGASDDAYSYISCLQRGYTFRFIPKAEVKYQIPEQLGDHVRQSMRHQIGMEQMARIFNPTLIAKETNLPFSLLATFAIQFLYKHPLSFSTYLLVMVLTFIMKGFYQRPNINTWTVATSSKPTTPL